MRSLTTIPIRIVDHLCKEITEAIQEFTELVFNEIEDRLCPIYMEVDGRIKVTLDTEIANMRDSFKQSQYSFKMVDSEYRRKQTLEKMKYLIRQNFHFYCLKYCIFYRPCEVLHREIQIRVAQTDDTILNKINHLTWQLVPPKENLESLFSNSWLADQLVVPSKNVLPAGPIEHIYDGDLCRQVFREKGDCILYRLWYDGFEASFIVYS